MTIKHDGFSGPGLALDMVSADSNKIFYDAYIMRERSGMLVLSQ